MPQIEHYFEPTPPPTLYHYTGIGSLLSIAKSNCIWAGSIRYMNDAKELFHAFDRIDDLLTMKVNSSPPGNVRYDFLSQLLKWMDDIKEAENYHLFTFSLSEVPSLLSQWRSYTPHGKGLSIGFGQYLLREMAASTGFRLGKCLYEEDEHYKLIESLLDTLWASAQLDPGSQKTDHFSSHRRYYATFDRMKSDIYQALALIKHEAFQEEREWRLISPMSEGLDNCNFREGGTMLIPYLEVKLDRSGSGSVFDCITIGPTPHQDLSMPVLKSYLAKENLCSTVHHCEIPYREW